MRILVACEESQTVCTAFRERGHEAYSCDILDCSGGHPEWHIKDDVRAHLADGWDMMIGHPPCTFLTYAGEGWFNVTKYGAKAIERQRLRMEAVDFFMTLWNAPIKKIAIEQPRGYISHYLRHTQIIQPWYFGDPHKKTTLLYLKNLPRLNGQLEIALQPTIFEPQPLYIDKKGKKRYFTDSMSATKDRRQLRSKTFPGIARAMAEQWG